MFAVASDSDEVIQIVNAIFGDLEQPTGALTDHLPMFAVTRTSADAWTVVGPEVGVRRAPSLARAIAVLVTSVNLAALRTDPGRLHLHAGAVARPDGRAVVIAAARETGKTTLVARLALAGMAYLTDETVSLTTSDDLIRAFAKPLSIKPGGLRTLPELTTRTLPAGGGQETEILHVPPSALGAPVVQHAVPHTLVLLRREGHSVGGRSPRVERIHPADAAVGLMAEAMDAGRFGENAMYELARLAARSHCYVVNAGDPEVTANRVRDLLDDIPAEGLAVRRLPTGAQPVARDVATVQIGDRAVVHKVAEGGVAIAIDAAATQVWLSVGSWRRPSDGELSAPEVRRFVSQLAQLGLVDPEQVDTAGR